MTEPAPEGIETKDVHSQMMSNGDFETKNLPGGYLPAGVPNTDRTGTQKDSGDSGSAADGETAEGTERDSGTGAGAGTPDSSSSGSGASGRKTTTTSKTASKS